jgi:hypothetical protein
MNNLCYKIVATPDLCKILYERCLKKINFFQSVFQYIGFSAIWSMSFFVLKSFDTTHYTKFKISEFSILKPWNLRVKQHFNLVTLDNGWIFIEVRNLAPKTEISSQPSAPLFRLAPAWISRVVPAFLRPW